MQPEMTNKDMDVAYHCLRAVLYGPFIEDSEFPSRLGMTRGEMQQIASLWGAARNDPRSGVSAAILACMNEVCHGIRFSDQEWRFWFSESPEEIRQVYLKWEGAARGRGTADS